MKLQTSATGVLERTSRLMRAGNFKTGHAISEPSWYKVVAMHPPSHDLTAKTHNLNEFVNKAHKFPIGSKRSKQGTYVTRNKTQYTTRTQHLYRPRQIHFFEDKIRRLFYDQHPWELARPKLVVENDGKDSTREDWSSIEQPRKKLDGESVVRRAIFLIENGEFDQSKWVEAYDKARLEFYRLRMREEAEIQVTTEEATMFGSVFGKSYIDYGIDEEQKVIDKWVKDAVAATAARDAKFPTSSSTNVDSEAEESS